MDISVMEYLHILNPFYYFSSNNKDPKKPKNPYYNRVYLCLEKDYDNHGLPIKGFHCFQYHHFEEAHKEYYNIFSRFGRPTIIPICKYVPSYFDPFIVNYKLKKMFWLGNHTFLKRTKKNKE